MLRPELPLGCGAGAGAGADGWYVLFWFVFAGMYWLVGRGAGGGAYVLFEPVFAGMYVPPLLGGGGGGALFAVGGWMLPPVCGGTV